MDYMASQTPLSMGFPRQGYWSGLPFPPPEYLSDLGIEPTSLASPALSGGFFTTSATLFRFKSYERNEVVRVILSFLFNRYTGARKVKRATLGHRVLHAKATTLVRCSALYMPLPG